MSTQEKIRVSQLTIGMYVHKLDRPWAETPFSFQGFYIRTKHEIQELQRFCKGVYIDCEKGAQPYKESKISKDSPLLPQGKAKPSYVNTNDLKKITLDIGRYEKGTKPFIKEINNAKVLFSDLSHSIEQISFNLRVGKKLNISDTEIRAKSVVASVIKNPNTMIWLSRLKSNGDYTYNHSLRSSILAIVFGRYLGLNQDELISLATGVLMADIGKTKIQRTLLNSNKELTKSEKAIMESHVELGVEMLAADKSVAHSTIVIVETHHERFNGSGYPRGLVGEEIPFLGQIAGLVDVFDAISSKKTYGKQLTSAQAMDWLYSQRDQLFSRKIVDDFVQAIGLYPAGTIVELTDNSVALVVSHNPEKRLRPEVFLIKDDKRNNLNSPKTIDLSKRPFLSKVDRPMVKKALLPEEIQLTQEKLSTALKQNAQVHKTLFG